MERAPLGYTRANYRARTPPRANPPQKVIRQCSRSPCPGLKHTHTELIDPGDTQRVAKLQKEYYMGREVKKGSYSGQPSHPGYPSENHSKKSYQQKYLERQGRTEALAASRSQSRGKKYAFTDPRSYLKTTQRQKMLKEKMLTLLRLKGLQILRIWSYQASLRTQDLTEKTHKYLTKKRVIMGIKLFVRMKHRWIMKRLQNRLSRWKEVSFHGFRDAARSRKRGDKLKATNRQKMLTQQIVSVDLSKYKRIKYGKGKEDRRTPEKTKSQDKGVSEGGKSRVAKISSNGLPEDIKGLAGALESKIESLYEVYNDLGRSNLAREEVLQDCPASIEGDINGRLTLCKIKSLFVDCLVGLLQGEAV